MIQVMTTARIWLTQSNGRMRFKLMTLACGMGTQEEEQSDPSITSQLGTHECVAVLENAGSLSVPDRHCGL
jgi:hypothetical protein